jgi:hypothetical protein
VKITSVQTQEYTRGIPLKGWESVETALKTFANGHTAGARDTEGHQLNAMSQSQGALGLGLYLLGAAHLQGEESTFVTDMLEKAKSYVKQHGRWSRNYDYDGVGVFFKTSVDITLLNEQDDLYMLEINAAYVGDKPERGLAQYLGVPLTLRYSSVIVQVESLDGEHFLFDFEQIIQAMKTVVTKVNDGSGTFIADYFISDCEYSRPEPLAIYHDQDIEITINTGRVENRFLYNKGDPVDTWAVDGSVLTGLLDQSYEDKNQKEPATLILTVQSSKRDRFEHALPVYDQELKEKIIKMSQTLAKALA